MRFSTKSSYGLRAMISLAKNYNKGSLSLATIAKKEGISLGYLERLMAQLKAKKLVQSTKGVKGGYVLAKAPSKISVKEILEALEKTLSPFYCVDIKCSKNCGAKKVWQKLDVAIKDTLTKMTLADLIK